MFGLGKNRRIGIKIAGGVLMILCEKTIDSVQNTNVDGVLRLCSWLNDSGIIGYLT